MTAFDDHLLGETIARLCAAPAFRSADVADVEPLSQRSLCFRVRFADGHRVVVKRTLPGRHATTADPVAREAAVLAALAPRRLPVPRPLLTLDDPDGTVLVTDDVTGRGPLDRCRERAGGTDPGWAAAAGRALAAVHAAPAVFLPGTNPVHGVVLRWTVVTPRAATLYADGHAEMLRLLRCSRLEEPLQAARAEWAPETAIHGDVRSAHVLCQRGPDGADAVRLVDWAAGGRGDPRWDVGCLIGDYLFGWLAGADLDGGGDLEDWMSAGEPPFAEVQEELSAATAAYAALRPVSGPDRRAWLRYAGLSLLQRLSEAARHEDVLPVRTLACLQVAAQLLRRPHECEELLLCR